MERTLSIGARLDPYEIRGPLGHGGMGEVDRAGDTKLGRDVAINVLPESLRTDPDRYELNWPALLSKVTQR